MNQLTAVHHYSKGIILRQKRADCKTERLTTALIFTLSSHARFFLPAVLHR
jgi:hypothetical protein